MLNHGCNLYHSKIFYVFPFYSRMERAFIVLLVVTIATADLYLHNPRGSNNRLNERSANRKNANRVFDSQVNIDKIM